MQSSPRRQVIARACTPDSTDVTAMDNIVEVQKQTAANRDTDSDSGILPASLHRAAAFFGLIEVCL